MKLKQCPFCGGNPKEGYLRYKPFKFWSDKQEKRMFVSTDPNKQPNETREYYVKCSSKRCWVWPSTNYFKSRRSARMAWNRRKA